MNGEKLLERLSQEFVVHVRSAYHFQIDTGKGYHNLWFSKGLLKLQLYGNSGWHYVTESKLLKELRAYNPGNTDLARMRSITAFISEVVGRTGIFVDAGWKNGKAKVAIIKSVSNGDMDITVRMIDAENSYAAEEWAILTAAELHPGKEPIFSDCQAAATKHPRAEWIPREQNKQADSLGNMRGKEK